MRDYQWRQLTSSDSADYIGRAVTTTDYLDRDLIGAAWASETTYEVGDFAELSSGVLLQATVAGTSGTAEPTAPGYDNTVTDGGVTWEQVTTV